MAISQSANPQDFLSIVANIRLLKWGNEVHVECLDDPVTRQSYLLVFKNCSEVRWFINEPESVNESEDNLIGVLLGMETHQKPAVITGEIFELWVTYESFEIQKS